jgi:hypothetical protein
MLGVVAPVLLMAAMVPIFVNALTKNLRLTEQEITQRALESDALSARLQAAALEHELNDRLEELEDILSNEILAKELELNLKRGSDELVTDMMYFAELPIASRPRWMQLLDSAWERSSTSNRQHGRGLDSSWFLTDANGIQIWRREFSEKTLGESFSYRDYFHGRGTDFSSDRIPEDIGPLQIPHVSLAYKSTTTGLQTVALSVPIRDSENHVIGVLARSANLGDLQSRLGQRMNDAEGDIVERIIALAESRNSSERRLLDHPYLTEELMASAVTSRLDEELLQGLRMDDETIRIISERLGTDDNEHAEVRLELYHDPVGRLTDPSAASYRGEWMAAMAQVRGTGWMVIVQERRDAALAPVHAMAGRASRQAWLAVLMAVVMMAIVWFFVWRAFSRTTSPRLATAAE